jgi:hypothetical protein
MDSEIAKTISLDEQFKFFEGICINPMLSVGVKSEIRKGYFSGFHAALELLLLIESAEQKVHAENPDAPFDSAGVLFNHMRKLKEQAETELKAMMPKNN